MTTRVWNGSTDFFLNPNAWTPAGVPSSGDSLGILTGTVLALGQVFNNEQVFLVGNGAPSSGNVVVPKIVLAGSVVDSQSSIETSNFWSNPFQLLPQAVGEIDAWGWNVNAGTISATPNGFPGSPAQLTVNINFGVLDNEGLLAARAFSGVLTVNQHFGFGILANDGTVDVDGGAQAQINAATVGTGTLKMEPVGFLHGGPDVASLELGSYVGSHQTVDFDGGGNLQIDDLKDFHAEIEGFAKVQYAGSDLESITLKGVNVTSFNYSGDETSGVLTLKTGSTVDGTLTFRGSYTTDSFHTSYANGNTSLTIADSQTATA